MVYVIIRGDADGNFVADSESLGLSSLYEVLEPSDQRSHGTSSRSGSDSTQFSIAGAVVLPQIVITPQTGTVNRLASSV